MNTLVKSKVNRLGRIGQIVAFLMILSAMISLVTGVKALVQIIQSMREYTEMLETIEGPVTDLTDRSWEFYNLLNAIGSVVQSVLTVVVYLFLMRVAEGFRWCDSPFADGVIRRMTVFAWVLLAYSIVAPLLFTVPNLIRAIREHYETVYLLDSIRVIVLPSFTLAVSLFVLFLVRIFRHGAELQREVDETL